jgi:hypothetical protein
MVMLVGEAPINNLPFNNSNINKMNLRLASGQVDVGAGGASEATEEVDALPLDDVNMDDIFDEIEFDSAVDPDYHSSDFDSRL